MNELIEHKNLKGRLDEIDQQIYQEVYGGFYESRLRIEIGMWEKGREIAEYRGVNSAISWLSLEKQTGRQRESLQKWQSLYQKHPDKEMFISKYAVPKAETWSKHAFQIGSDKVLLSKDLEWWTPQIYIDAVHKVINKIDLDPASCDEANKTVKAKKYYSQENDGLLHEWTGKVFLNPPYGDRTPFFIEKFISEYEKGNIAEGIILVNSRATDATWFQPLFDGLICFTNHRIDFDSPKEKLTSSTHGSCFIYFGPNKKKFADIFSQFGSVVQKFNG